MIRVSIVASSHPTAVSEAAHDRSLTSESGGSGVRSVRSLDGLDGVGEKR